jgi:hypothetical protein
MNAALGKSGAAGRIKPEGGVVLVSGRGIEFGGL